MSSKHQSASNDEELKLNPEVKERLLKLQRMGIDLNKLLADFLNERAKKIAEEKETLSREVKPTESRYIPVKIRNLLTEEFGRKCSMDQCHRDADEIHHTQRFSMSRRHDPKYLAPLCEEHHKIAHSIDLQYAECRLN